MPYNRDVIALQNKLQTVWGDIRVAFERMRPGIQIKPGDATSVFTADSSSGELGFNVGPVVLRVPERANSRSVNLFIVVSGWISFGSAINPDSRKTTLRFGTKVGYFRSNDGELRHVYGAHYDMDELLPGHPVFHGQICSQLELIEEITEVFREPFTVGDNLTEGILRNVRTPTAQMDVFSVITQIGADHLLTEASGPEVHEAFDTLRHACDFFVGAAGRLSYLNRETAARCYRSTHWYERLPRELLELT